jgi:hypothetical protein
VGVLYEAEAKLVSAKKRRKNEHEENRAHPDVQMRQTQRWSRVLFCTVTHLRVTAGSALAPPFCPNCDGFSPGLRTQLESELLRHRVWQMFESLFAHQGAGGIAVAVPAFCDLIAFKLHAFGI